MQADARAASMGEDTTEAGRRCSAKHGAGRIIAQLSIVIKILGAPKSVSDRILIPDNIIYTRISIYWLANVIASERRRARHRWSHVSAPCDVQPWSTRAKPSDVSGLKVANGEEEGGVER